MIDLCGCADCCYARAWYYRVHLHVLDARGPEHFTHNPMRLIRLLLDSFATIVRLALHLHTAIDYRALWIVAGVYSEIRMLQPRTWALTISGMQSHHRIGPVQPSHVVPYVLWCMCNPSNAGSEENDHTVRRVIAFTAQILRGRMQGNSAAFFDPSRRYRYALWRPGLAIVNLYALISTDPAIFADPPIEPVGPENERTILSLAAHACKIVIACGAPPKGDLYYRGQIGRIASLLTGTARIVDGHRVRSLPPARDLWCLGTTAQGYPRHPSRLATSTKLVPWIPLQFVSEAVSPLPSGPRP